MMSQETVGFWLPIGGGGGVGMGVGLEEAEGLLSESDR